MTKQKHKVLCVTKRTRSDENHGRDIKWHIPMPFDATVFTVRTEEFGVPVYKTKVSFMGAEHDLLYVRPGLCGTAVTLAVAKKDFPYDVWELYTDTPVSDDSIETIRQIARQEMAKHRY